MRPLRLAGLVVLLAIVVFSALVYGELPARIPQHFDAGGTPTREVATSAVSWFALPAISVAVWALLAWLGSLIPTHPELFNFPQKARFLALPAAQRAPVIVAMQWFLEATALVVIVVLGLVQLLVWRVATTGEAGVLATLPAAGILVVFGLTAVALVRLARAVGDAERRARDARG
ncbi:MAG TPA: DUF1648 domain-containing protein [Gemmatimonadaceae bacterium]|nr:DUF1648 domain-containing protein [Gemmatimonadaceae bacterium]